MTGKEKGLEACPSPEEAAAILGRHQGHAPAETPVPGSPNDFITLSHLSDAMYKIERAALYEDGTHQPNSEHSFRLIWLSVSTAAARRPDLNLEKVAIMALIHDMKEDFSGDTPVFDKELLRTKKTRELAGLAILAAQLSDHSVLVDLIDEYERKDTPEARFVSAMDKFEAIDFALKTKATTQRERGDDFRRNVKFILEKSSIDPTVFELSLRAVRELGEKWEEWGCKPIGDEPESVINKILEDLRQKQKQQTL